MRADAYTRHLYAADASMYAVEPLLVAFPRERRRRRGGGRGRRPRIGVPVVSRGGGTSLAGQAAGGRGIVLDHSRHLDAIGEIDVADRRVRVEPGVVQEALNAAAKPHGLGFGPDTSTSNRATLGGMIGNNSSGSASILHGTTIDHVLELEVVLADGSRATLRAARRGGVGAARAGGHARGRDPPRPARDPRAPRPRDRRGLPEALAPVRRLPARPLRRLRRARPRAARHGLGGHARRDHGGDRAADRAAARDDVRGRALRLAGGRDRRHRGRPGRSARRRSR